MLSNLTSPQNSPPSDNYLENFVSALKDSERAAGYLEAILEEKEPEVDLLANALQDIILAKIQANQLSEHSQLLYQELKPLLLLNGWKQIYKFIELLNALGFRLEIRF